MVIDNLKSGVSKAYRYEPDIDPNLPGNVRPLRHGGFARPGTKTP
ncbi:hypothetical protein DFAR_2210054 [Desulfarculales bacterium]